MVKWASLNTWQQRKLLDQYDKKNADKIPTKPEFKQPGREPYAVVQTGRGTDLYARMGVPTNDPSQQRAIGTLRLVGSSEHIEIDLPLNAIPKLIEQLHKLHNDMQAHNAAVNAHQEARKAYDEAMENYEAERVKAISNRLSSNQWTKEDIDVRADEIPF